MTATADRLHNTLLLPLRDAASAPGHKAAIVTDVGKKYRVRARPGYRPRGGF